MEIRSSITLSPLFRVPTRSLAPLRFPVGARHVRSLEIFGELT